MTEKKGLLAAGSLILIIAAIYAVNAIWRTPKIMVDPPFKDLGDVSMEGFNYTFTVKNIGNKVLKIERVSTSCGCTLASIDKEFLTPGETAGLHVTFNPRLMEEEVKGSVTRVIFIKNNDPSNPDVEIKMTANVVSS